MDFHRLLSKSVDQLSSPAGAPKAADGGAPTAATGADAAQLLQPLNGVSVQLGYALTEVAELEAAAGLGRAPTGLQLAARLSDIRASLEEARRMAAVAKQIVRQAEQPAEPKGDHSLDVRRVLDAVVAEMWTGIEERGRFVKDFGEVPLVSADPCNLALVIRQLLSNALAALTGDRERQEIRITTRTDRRGWAVVQISDNGPGIPSDTLQTLFDPSRRQRGGLLVCAAIVEGMGGGIDVESIPQKGTLVRLNLPPDRESQRSMVVAAAPRSSVAEPPARESARQLAARPVPGALVHRAGGGDHLAREAERKRESSRGLRAAQAVSPRRGRILVVDDDAKATAIVLRALGVSHDVIVVSNARAALDRLRSGDTFDIILSDFMMRDLWGRAFHDELANLTAADPDRVIFMFKDVKGEGIDASLRRPTNLMLQKPLDPEELRLIVEQRLPSA